MSDDLIESISNLVGKSTILPVNLVRQVLTVLSDVTAKPDIRGTIEVYDFGEFVILGEFLGARDAFQPTISPSIATEFELGSRMRFRFTLTDEDLSNDDPMGVFELTEAELLDAANSMESTVWIDVSQQTLNQILAVQVSVNPQ